MNDNYKSVVMTFFVAFLPDYLPYKMGNRLFVDTYFPKKIPTIRLGFSKDTIRNHNYFRISEHLLMLHQTYRV